SARTRSRLRLIVSGVSPLLVSKMKAMRLAPHQPEGFAIVHIAKTVLAALDGGRLLALNVRRHQADMLGSGLRLALVAELVKPHSLRLTDLFLVLLGVVIREADELAAKPEQPAKDVLRHGVLLLPDAELLVVIFVD